MSRPTPAEHAEYTAPVWPCRKCDRPQAPHRVDCFWATHQQGAVEGMRYAWTPSEAKLGEAIERHEDAARELVAELTDARRTIRDARRTIRFLGGVCLFLGAAQLFAALVVIL